MKKNKIIVVITLIVLLISIVIVAYITKEDSILSKEKLFAFENYNLLQDNVSLLSKQSEIDNDIIQKVESGKYTFDNPLVMLNPYEVSPLTAIIGLKTDEKVSITVTIKAKSGGKDLVYKTKKSNIHYIPVYGLYMDYENKIQIAAGDNINTINIPVEGIDLNLYFSSNVVVNKNDLPEGDNDFFFVSTSRGAYAVAYDQKGEIRWFLTNQIHKQLSKLSNGNYLLSNSDIINDNQSTGMIEIDALGKVYNNYGLTDNYLHKYVELPNGNILYSSTDGKIIELNLKNGKVEKIYDINQIIKNIDKNQTNIFKEKFTLTADDMHDYISSLDYDAKTDSILVGIYHYSTLINLNRNGTINWIFAKPEYYSTKFTKYLLSPTNSDFIYPLGNYNSKYEDGKLTLMDNGWDYSISNSCSMVDQLNSSARDFTIDVDNKKITEVRKYAKDYFSYRFGDYQVKGDERIIMFAYEFTSFVEPPQKCIMHNEPNFDSKIIVLNKEDEVFEMTISNSHNYLDKRSIIDENYDFKKVEAKYFVANKPSDSYEKQNYKDNFNKSVINNLPFVLLGNKLQALYNEDNYKIILMDEYGNGYKYTPQNNEIKVKQGEGKLLILIEKDNKIYNTGQYINL